MYVTHNFCNLISCLQIKSSLIRSTVFQFGLSKILYNIQIYIHVYIQYINLVNQSPTWALLNNMQWYD